MDKQSTYTTDSQVDDTVVQSEELEYQRIPPSKQLSGKYFLGAYSGEHVAGTEFVIGPIDYVKIYKWLIVPLTEVYFIAATLWFRNRRRIEPIERPAFNDN